jgi:hypothetical protein
MVTLCNRCLAVVTTTAHVCPSLREVGYLDRSEAAAVFNAEPAPDAPPLTHDSITAAVALSQCRPRIEAAIKRKLGDAEWRAFLEWKETP